MARVKFNKQGAIRLVRYSATQASYELMKEVFDESQRQVPVFSGNLRDSGSLNQFGTRITITYSAPYAAIQHENLNFKHPNGGKAKYLEDPYREITSNVNAKLSQKIKKFMK